MKAKRFWVAVLTAVLLLQMFAMPTMAAEAPAFPHSEKIKVQYGDVGTSSGKGMLACTLEASSNGNSYLTAVLAVSGAPDSTG